MKYSIEKAEKWTLFALEEETLNSIIAPDLKSEFITMHSGGRKNLILDLSAVKFVDSSGLSAILTGNRLFKSIGSFILTGIVHPSVQKLISISRLDTVLTILPTVQESKDYIMLEELEKDINTEATE